MARGRLEAPRFHLTGGAVVNYSSSGSAMVCRDPLPARRALSVSRPNADWFAGPEPLPLYPNVASRPPRGFISCARFGLPVPLPVSGAAAPEGGNVPFPGSDAHRKLRPLTKMQAEGALDWLEAHGAPRPVLVFDSRGGDAPWRVVPSSAGAALAGPRGADLPAPRAKLTRMLEGDFGS